MVSAGVQEAVLADLRRRRDAGANIPSRRADALDFSRLTVSRAYRSLAGRGLIELWHTQLYRRGKGMLVILR